MRNKVRGRLLIAAGALLLTAAVSLVLFNRIQDSKAGEHAEKQLVLVKEHIAAQPADSKQPDESLPQDPETPEPESESEPEALELDGEYYIGIVAIPKLGIELPVMRDWSEEKMAEAPCCYSGTAAGRDMVICAHNYSTFFAELDTLESGDEVIYTELSGRQRRYTVGWTELINGWDTAKMTSGSDSWDLTLFTCTWAGYSRVTVRCTEIK
ncbi:MAG: sortase [Ruminococcus sp.]|nr:sortase [Ruminococcus sp.]